MSPRTFFNYFPSKECAIAYASLEIPPKIAAEFVAAGSAPHSVLLGDVMVLTIRDPADNPPSREKPAEVFAVSHSSVAVASAVSRQFDQFERRLAGSVPERAGMKPGEGVPTLIAAIAMSTMRNGMVGWTSAPPKNGDDTAVSAECGEVCTTLIQRR